MRLFTNATINKLERFIKSSINVLTNCSYTCTRFDLSDIGEHELAIYMGWSEGYCEDDTDLFHDKDKPSRALNIGIKIRNDSDWSDYEYLNSPIYTNDESVFESDNTLFKDLNYRLLARTLLNKYKTMRKCIDSGKLTIDF